MRDNPICAAEEKEFWLRVIAVRTNNGVLSGKCCPWSLYNSCKVLSFAVSIMLCPLCLQFRPWFGGIFVEIRWGHSTVYVRYKGRSKTQKKGRGSGNSTGCWRCNFLGEGDLSIEEQVRRWVLFSWGIKLIFFNDSFPLFCWVFSLKTPKFK